MFKPRLLFVFAFFLLGWVAAQGSAVLTEVRVSGASSETTERLIRVNLVARAGTAVDRLNLEAERNRVLSMGIFSEVSLSVEDRGSGPVLFVRVKENPQVAAIKVEGASGFTEAQLKSLLEQRNLLRTGAPYNTTRAQEGILSLQQLYREQGGFPYDVPVTLDVEPLVADDGASALKLVYTVAENAPIKDVVFEDSQVLDAETLEAAFKPLERAGAFDPAAYRQAVITVAQTYQEQGYRGSGVDLTRTRLESGTLMVRLKELTIGSIDASAIGLDAGAFSLAEGDLYNYDLLLQDVRRLARGRSSDVRLVDPPLVLPNGEVRVVVETGPPDSAGPVERVVIEGNTAVATEELLPLLSLQEGDTFTSALATEDFRIIQDDYGAQGYFLVARPDFAYLDDGTYVQRIQELRIVGYDIVFDSEEARTNEEVITRYLPAPGSLYNREEVRSGLLQATRSGVIKPVNEQPTAPDPSKPAEVVSVIVVSEQPSRSFSPAVQYATDTGFTASIGYSDNNLFGEAHTLGAEVTANTTDVGFRLGGSVRYSVPWLYVDFLDFKEVPTSVSASVFSVTQSNQSLIAEGGVRVLYPGLNDVVVNGININQVFVGEYSQRDTGLSFSVGRPILENTSLRFSMRGSYTAYELEPPSESCTFNSEGNVEDRNCALPSAYADAYLPPGGLSSFISTSMTYDDRDNINFPTTGVAATGRVGVGFGNDYQVAGERQGYIYETLEFGVKTYLDLDDPQQVVAFKANAGHQFGQDYPAGRYFQVGNTTNEATKIRGYAPEDFNPSRSYLTGTVEYRYDFDFSSLATETVIALAFLDVGWVSSVPGFDEYGAPLFAGAGVGLQLNLGIGGVAALPPIRLEYGFSERNPYGVFTFGIGPVF